MGIQYVYISAATYCFIVAFICFFGVKDLENVVVKNRNGSPILVRDVAKVNEGISLRYGASTKDGKGEIVCGLALMLKGENSSAVVERIKEKMIQINKTLPEGVVAEVPSLKFHK